jgi:hypothetical protein
MDASTRSDPFVELYAFKARAFDAMNALTYRSIQGSHWECVARTEVVYHDLNPVFGACVLELGSLGDDVDMPVLVGTCLRC